MADTEQVKILQQGTEDWNRWRRANPRVKPELSGADLNGANLSKVNLRRANLDRAKLKGANLSGAALVEARLNGAKLRAARLQRADLRGAKLIRAQLVDANLTKARLGGADLSNAHLQMATLVGTDLTDNAILTGAQVHGVSVWGLKIDQTTVQRDLVITRAGEPTVTTDSIEVAQFIYLLLHNEQIRTVIDTITSKVVLILGRFTRERKAVLDAIREELRRRDLTPVLFDFDKPDSRDLTETISTLAHMARFVIADITEAKSIPQELQAIVPGLPSVPIQPLLKRGAAEYGMFEHIRRYPWVRPIYRYEDAGTLIAALSQGLVATMNEKASELQQGKGGGNPG